MYKIKFEIVPGLHGYLNHENQEVFTLGTALKLIEREVQTPSEYKWELERVELAEAVY
tara:strand:- start:679 stop:852 length:174 start_codon:yes stop_codon:yes gene_type:complete